MTEKRKRMFPIKPMVREGEKSRRFCDLVFEDGRLFLETKYGKQINRISFEEFLQQINTAKMQLN